MTKGVYKRKPFSEEHKRKLSKAQQGKKHPWGTRMLGKHHTKETKEKMRLAKIGKSTRKGEKCNFWKGGIYNYDRKLFLNERRRARKLNAEGSHAQGEWELLKKQYGFKCPACGRLEPKIKLTEDHIIPLDKGGSDYIENIQPLCRSCNCKKHTKIIKYNNQ